MHLYEVAEALNATAVGGDVAWDRVTTDSRGDVRGALFVALRGDRFDAHQFVADVLARGAAAVMIAADAGLDVAPALVVADTRIGLGQLAAWHRQQMPAKLVAITGSNGKTTVKEMTAAILRAEVGVDAVLATEGNLNNDYGLPLTLLQLSPAHRYCVAEMGMNHPGELDYLTRLARPDVALVNNAQRAHLAGLGTLAAVAAAKGEIYAGLTADGVAIINAEDAHAALWRGLAGAHRVIAFGLSDNADVRAERMGDGIVLSTPQGRIETRFTAPGEHNLRNAAAATAAALALGASLDAVARGLAGYAGVKGRLQAHACILGARLIDDTYNANPDSVSAAIAVLAAEPGHRVLVLGDMGELGPEAAALHAEIGVKAKAAGIDRLLTLGDLAIHAARAFGAGGQHFELIEDLLASVEVELAAHTTVLVKGSRFMRMERVVQSFMEDHLCS
ncbi:MAG: UDP-N-acetylmuramoyl-tripeptide--D-alanyl-D-alanine ligase [Betaproteobacteria bacterium]|nr:MAG: UDP-N-acetylmuramoyl-tripeptide--D-alanyl-D-alanine ligase [Betaproteobacteria bacterium]